MSTDSKEQTLYHVRQYRPAYFSGFDDIVIKDVPYGDITKVSFCDNFKHSDFDKFTVSPYGDELIIVAYYKSGVHWVVGFAVNRDSPFASNWRYNTA